MQNDSDQNNRHYTINLGVLVSYLNASMYRYGIMLLILAAKSVLVTWGFNLAISNHTSFSLKFGEVFLGLIALAIVGSCVRDNTIHERNAVILSMHNTLFSLASNQVMQNMQILGGLSLLIKKFKADDEEPEAEQKTVILNESDTEAPEHPPSGLDNE